MKASPSPAGAATQGQLTRGGCQQRWGARRGPPVRTPALQIGSSCDFKEAI